MRTNFIFSSTADINKTELYEESYITYFVCNLLYSNPLTKDEIISSTESHLNVGINNSKFTIYLNKSLSQNDEGLYVLSSRQEDAVKKVKKLKNDLFILEWDQETDLYKQIGKYISFGMFDVDLAIPYVIAVDKIRNKKDDAYYLSIFFNLIINKESNFSKLDQAIGTIDDYYFDLPLKDIFINKVVLDLLFANGFYAVKDLASVPIDVIYTLISVDMDNCISALSQLQEDSKHNFKHDLKELFDSLNPKELEVISLRNGFSTDEKTLEETGRVFGLTRERCRQIESKATAKLIVRSDKMKCQLLTIFIFLTTTVERRYISSETIFNYFEDELLAKYYLFLIENSSLDLKYDADLNIVYNSSLVSIDELTNEIVEAYGPYIYEADYNALNDFEKSVVRAKYKESYKNFYLLKGYTNKELIGLIVDDLFPNGYRIGNIDDYNLLAKEFREKYKTDEVPSDRSVVGFLDRLDYCQINKGTYKNRKLCVQLSQEQVDKIVNYILQNQPTIYYQSIYEKFKIELNELGINNYFYLKGIIDPYLPEDFVTKRNYIICGNNLITGYEAMLMFIKTFNGKFSINDLRDKFVGVKDYTFYNLLINEAENGLIWLQNKNFIYVDKVVITETTINELKEYIDSMFIQLNAETISSRKIFARLSLTNKSLLENLKIASDNFSLFSIIKYFFKDDYGYNRPLISKDKDAKVSTYSLITNYANSLDSFNSKTIGNYVSKMNIGGLYSYLSFMEDMSDNFVQVNIDTMYKKDKISISEQHLRDFKGMMDLIFSRFNSIDTRQFNGYQMLPNIPYHWNKYLLVGIIRTYFSEEFEVENTDSTYDQTDFIIRRNK